MSATSKRGGARIGAGRKPKSIDPTNAAFDGAGYSPSRTLIYMPNVEAKHEMSEYDAAELRMKSRWFYNNYGVAAGAIDLPVRLATGPGISPQARTENLAWNKEIEARFEAKCGTSAIGFDVSQQVNFYEAEALILRQALVDGDFFAQPLLSKSGAGMIRFIGGEYVGNAMSAGKQDEWIDGVRVSQFGAPVQFRVLKNGPGSRDFTDISADNMWQFKRPYRHGFVRTPPILRHAVNHLHDMADILKFTKGSFKLASQIAFILESAEAGKVGLGSNLVQTSTGNGTVTTDKMYPLAGHVQTKPGEKITPLKNEHPGQSFDPFMKFLIRDIAAGFGIPPELFWDITQAGGANMRGALALAEYVCEELQQMLINQFCRRFWNFWVWHEIQSGRVSYPGDDWWKCEWITPRRPTVDFTKDGKLLADLVSRGLLSPERYYGMQGLDADTEEETIIRRQARRKKLVQEIAIEEKIELSVQECFPPAPGSAPVEPPPESAPVE